MENQTIQLLEAEKLNFQEQEELASIVGKAFPIYIDFRKQGFSKGDAYQKVYENVFSELTDSNITAGDFRTEFDRKRIDYDLMLDKLKKN